MQRFVWLGVLTAVVLLQGRAGRPLAARTLPADTVAVTVGTFQFRPDRLEVRPGTTVVWINQDEIEHTTTSGAPKGDGVECEASGRNTCSSIGSFNLPLAQKGARTAFTFDKPGRHAYYCARHPFMRGEIHVTLKGDSK